jgi:hypothetical protein
MASDQLEHVTHASASLATAYKHMLLSTTPVLSLNNRLRVLHSIYPVVRHHMAS